MVRSWPGLVANCPGVGKKGSRCSWIDSEAAAAGVEVWGTKEFVEDDDRVEGVEGPCGAGGRARYGGNFKMLGGSLYGAILEF